jgi:hypothetical protein
VAGIEAGVVHLTSRARRAPEGARAAADAMAQEYVRGISENELRRYTHSPGTSTTSPAGEPPALVTGTLRRSIRITPATGGPERWTSSVRPTVVYARIQELGGDINPIRARLLKFRIDGHWYSKKKVHLPPRPYMRPAKHRMSADGSLRRAAKAAFDEEVGRGG